MAAPLTTLTSQNFPFVRSRAADKAFSELNLFHVCPHTHLSWSLSAVYGGGERLGLGAGESSRRITLCPCAFFSHKLSPAERNNIGNWELLAVKLALEEWRHQLGGVEQPFGLTIKTFSTSAQPNGWTHASPGGLYSLTASTFFLSYHSLCFVPHLSEYCYWTASVWQ